MRKSLMLRTVLISCFLTSVGSLSVMAQQERPVAPQKTGQIEGTIDYCGPGGNNGLVVHIPGKSFQAKLGPTGEFALFFVPPATQTVEVEIPGRPSFSILNVATADNKIADLGTVTICRDSDGDTHNESVDCNDNNPNIHPFAEEVCDSFDNNCDGAVDEGCDVCTDNDNDGFFAQTGCLTLVDCNDSDPLTSPTSPETCDDVDNNCNTQVDEGFDLSSDPANCGACGNVCSFANAASTCTGSSCEFVECLSGFADCDANAGNGCETNVLFDSDNCGACGNVCPSGIGCSDGACVCIPEVCGDNIDNNCDGLVDEVCASCIDADADGSLASDPSCPTPFPDCNDSDPNIRPGAPEVCDGVDNDCDGDVDEGCVCTDADGDGLGNGTLGNIGCLNSTTDADDGNQFVCADTDGDTCDDCSLLGSFNPNNDGPDTNGDGICDAGEN